MTGTGTRGAGFLLFGSELLSVAIDARWVFAFLLFLLIADFRYGWGESNKRYQHAKDIGDTYLMDKYKWRTSRAVRRTSNKFVDYVILMLVCGSLGMALLEPIGIMHTWGAYFGAAIAVYCEGKSIIGHFFYLRGVQVEEKTVTDFIRAFIVALAKRGNQNVGEALDEALNHKEGNDGNN